MTKKQLSALLGEIQKTDKEAQKRALGRLEILAKPPGSLGVLEEIAARLAAITGEVYNTLDKRRVIVLAADNGVVEEGVSSAPKSVTAMQTINILNGVTGMAVLAKQYSAEVSVIDVGIDADIDHKRLISRKIRRSTGNIVREPAMSYDETLEALEVGAEAAQQAAVVGCKVIGVGEMGIGNTTTSTAVLACLLGTPSDELHTLCGRGAGLTDAAYANKIDIIGRAIALHHPDKADPIAILSAVGGLDLAAMTGVFLGAASCRLPVVIDGFISVVAALCATRLCPAAADYMFASHCSAEPGYLLAAEAVGVKPCLQMQMRLGEGSGCPIMFSVMDGACAVIKNMATFDEGQIDSTYLETLN